MTPYHVLVYGSMNVVVLIHDAYHVLVVVAYSKTEDTPPVNW